jgi:hypothetical protein
VEFDYTIDSGTGADGLAFGLVTDPDYPPLDGGCLDFCPGTGAHGVEFDTFMSNTNGWNDPPGDHIGVVEGCTSSHLTTVPAQTRGTHHVRIDFDSGRVIVEFDGAPVLDYTIAGYAAVDRHFGWSAATGV